MMDLSTGPVMPILRGVEIRLRYSRISTPRIGKHGAVIMAAPHQMFANSRRLEQQFGRELQLPRWERTRD